MPTDPVNMKAATIASGLGVPIAALYTSTGFRAKDENRSLKKRLTANVAQADHLLQVRAKQFGGDVRARLKAKLQSQNLC